MSEYPEENPIERDFRQWWGSERFGHDRRGDPTFFEVWDAARRAYGVEEVE